MGRYRKKETVVEAERFSAKTFDDFSKFCPAAKGMYYDEVKGAYYIIVPALAEDRRADEGDYIIKSAIGEFYPCKSDVFECLYEEECKALGDENRELYRAALDTFGEEAQVKMLFEEIGELMAAICQYSRGRDKRAHVAEEIADVRIMIDQMTVLFDCENEMERQRSYKLRRLEQRIEGARGNA